MSNENYPLPESRRRYRPSRHVASSGEEQASTVLSPEFTGMAVAYGNTLLFIGYEVNGLVEVAVHPRYRFSSDDRVQGQLGYVHVPYGTPWEQILPEVDRIFEMAQENYRFAVTQRSTELRAHGSRFESAYEAITDIFRESWHGFALRLNREHTFVKSGVAFTGHPPGPVLATWRDRPYTVMVFPTGSITMLTGDKRDVFSKR